MFFPEKIRDFFYLFSVFSFGRINFGSVRFKIPGIIVIARKLDVNITIATRIPM